MPTFCPPLQELDRLGLSLQPAEHEVAERLQSLGEGWTVHVKPRIGIDRPDFVATHERFGVCAIEVRNWNATTHRADGAGLIEELGSGDTVTRVAHPRFVAARVRESIYDRHYALPGDETSTPTVVRAAVVLPGCSTDGARALLVHPVAAPAEREIPVWGADALHSTLDAIVHGEGCPPPAEPSMRRLLADIVTAGRRSPSAGVVPLTPFAEEIAGNPLGVSMRRARGPAGSGKSFALASRAAALAAEGRQVLALTFSVTMSYRLRELVNLHCERVGADPTLVVCCNFHSFCEQVVDEAAQVGVEAMQFPAMRFADSIVSMAMHVFSAGYEQRFDAVLVDEGQDFSAAWWHVLRDKVVAPDGEMLLASDERQDIYDRSVWTDEEECVRAGFTEPWIDACGSQRMPADVRELAGRFSEANLFGDDVRNPFPEPDGAPIGLQHPSPSFGRWQNVGGPMGMGREIGREVVRLLRAHPDLSPGEVTFLCEHHDDGEDAVAEIESAGYPVHHVFSHDPDDPRRNRRYRLWRDSGAVTGCTVHSFKGSGSRALVMGIGLETRSKRPEYVSLTRVAADPAGRSSFLSVVNADPRVADFAETFDSILSWSPDPVVSWDPPRESLRVG